MLLRGIRILTIMRLATIGAVPMGQIIGFHCLLQRFGGGVTMAANGVKRASVVLIILLAAGIPRFARADLKVRMPTVDFREVELEHNGFYSFDKDRTLGGQQSYTNSIGYGVTPWWKVELEGESNSVPDSSVHYTATTIENTFQLTQPGEYFFNLGLFAEYSQSALNSEPNSFTVGPIVQKELFDVLGVDSLHTLNVFFGHDVGHNASHATSLDVAWQSILQLNTMGSSKI
jgi:hypothetical protein